MFRVVCHLCNIQFEHNLELEVHQLSLSHHIKLDATDPGCHTCLPCEVTCATLGEYSKHVDTPEHRKRRDRMTAIIDSTDACQEQTPWSTMANLEGNYTGVTPGYAEHSAPFFQNGMDRRAYAAPNWAFQYGMAYPQCGEGSSGSFPMMWQRPGADMDFYGQHSMFPPRSGFFFGMQENRRPYNGDKSTEKRGDEHRGELLNRAQTSAHRDENVERCSSHMKQDIPAKKSRRIKRRGKGSSKSTSDEKTGTLEKTDKKIKKKKSPIQTPSSSAKCDTEHKGSVVQVMKRIRGVPLGASMKDKTKKWELVAVKGKASYLRNRSQRMLKDRMNKYRLVDSKGVVVEGTSEEEPCTSSNMPRSLSSGTNETSLSHQSSYKSGTASETVSKTQRKQYDGKISVSSTPSAVAPSTSSTSFARSSVLSSVSTPRGSNNAVLAYGDSRGLSTTNVESIRDIQLKKASDDSSSALDGRDKRSVHISSDSPPVNPSVAVESRSVTSRADSTSLGNVTNPPCLLTVKEEPTESPPPVVLPSPPHIDRTVSCPTTAAEGNIAGEKEREEFWMLGIAEMKKGQEIHAARLKIENLQKALIEATSDLGRMEVEMNEILRRKSELLGISVPDNFA